MLLKRKITLKNVVKVECFLNDKENTKVCDLEWEEMPPAHVSFDYKKKEYMIIKIKDSKITVKVVPPRRKKNG